LAFYRGYTSFERIYIDVRSLTPPPNTNIAFALGKVEDSTRSMTRLDSGDASDITHYSIWNHLKKPTSNNSSHTVDGYKNHYPKTLITP
jgi:hypothetical protein